MRFFADCASTIVGFLLFLTAIPFVAYIACIAQTPYDELPSGWWEPVLLYTGAFVLWRVIVHLDRYYIGEKIP